MLNDEREGRDFGIGTASFFKNQTEYSDDSFNKLTNALAAEIKHLPQ